MKSKCPECGEKMKKVAVDIECADDISGVQFNAADICKGYTVTGCDSSCQAVKYNSGT